MNIYPAHDDALCVGAPSEHRGLATPPNVLDTALTAQLRMFLGHATPSQFIARRCAHPFCGAHGVPVPVRFRMHIFVLVLCTYIITHATMQFAYRICIQAPWPDAMGQGLARCPPCYSDAAVGGRIFHPVCICACVGAVVYNDSLIHIHT